MECNLDSVCPAGRGRLLSVNGSSLTHKYTIGVLCELVRICRSAWLHVRGRILAIKRHSHPTLGIGTPLRLSKGVSLQTCAASPSELLSEYVWALCSEIWMERYGNGGECSTQSCATGEVRKWRWVLYPKLRDLFRQLHRLGKCVFLLAFSAYYVSFERVHKLHSPSCPRSSIVCKLVQPSMGETVHGWGLESISG